MKISIFSFLLMFLVACGGQATDENQTVAFNPADYTGDNQFVQLALTAIEGGDFYEIDGMRDVIQKEDVAPFVATFNPNYPQQVKNDYVNILMDQTGDVVAPVMKEGLHSDSPDVRASAYVCLTGEFDMYSTFYDRTGFVKEASVDSAIAVYLKSN